MLKKSRYILVGLILVVHGTFCVFFFFCVTSDNYKEGITINQDHMIGDMMWYSMCILSEKRVKQSLNAGDDNGLVMELLLRVT